MKLLFVIVLTVLALVACGDSKMKSMSDNELSAKRDECLAKNPTAPGRATACENIRKECERRRKEGNYAC